MKTAKSAKADRTTPMLRLFALLWTVPPSCCVPSAGTLAVNACAVIESAMLAPVTLNASLDIRGHHGFGVCIPPRDTCAGHAKCAGHNGNQIDGFDSIAHQVFAKGFVFDVGRLLIDPEFAFIGGQRGRRHTGACIANNGNRQCSTMVSPTFTV